MIARRWGAAALLVLTACGGTQLEGFGSPRSVKVATWKGWCAVRAELVRTYDAFFARKTLTHGEFISSTSRLQIAAADWSAEARRDGATDVANLIASVSEGVGHTKVAVDTKGETLGPRREFAVALGALPPCVNQADPGAVPSASTTQSQSTTPTATSTSTAPDCRSVDLNVSLALDRRTYPAGQIVRITMTAGNTASEGCTIRTGRCQDVISIDNAGGAEVWNSGATTSCPAPVVQILFPGASASLAFSWDQNCTPSDCGGTVPPGSYTAHGSWTARGGRTARPQAQKLTITEPSTSPSPTSSQSSGIIPAPQ